MEYNRNGVQMDHLYKENDIEAFKSDSEGHYFESFERAHVTEGMDIDILCAKPYTGMAGLIQLASLQKFT